MKRRREGGAAGEAGENGGPADQKAKRKCRHRHPTKPAFSLTAQAPPAPAPPTVQIVVLCTTANFRLAPWVSDQTV